MKTLLILALFIALVGTNVIWFIRECEAERLKDSRDTEWQQAAKPVFDARGITYKDPTPDNLQTALDATRPLLPHEGYKGNPKWKESHDSQIRIEPVLKKQEYLRRLPGEEPGITVRKAIIPTINQE